MMMASTVSFYPNGYLKYQPH